MKEKMIPKKQLDALKQVLENALDKPENERLELLKQSPVASYFSEKDLQFFAKDGLKIMHDSIANILNDNMENVDELMHNTLADAFTGEGDDEDDEFDFNPKNIEKELEQQHHYVSSMLNGMMMSGLDMLSMFSFRMTQITAAMSVDSDPKLKNLLAQQFKLIHSMDNFLGALSELKTLEKSTYKMQFKMKDKLNAMWNDESDTDEED